MRDRIQHQARAPFNEIILEIHAGTGGTEAQWWVTRLLRMYQGFCKRQGFKTEELDFSPGTEAGLKSVVVQIAGRDAYRLLKDETGVHRLSRVSDFDSGGRRHTSFATVSVYPLMKNENSIQIKDSDLDIKTCRGSGPGGQHRNTTDSAVKIKHRPTGVVVSCQNERSQHQNKETALRLLKSKLAHIQGQAQQSRKQAEYRDKSGISWGYQVRTYILSRKQLIKDHRTGREYGNVDAVLDGNLDLLLR